MDLVILVVSLGDHLIPWQWPRTGVSAGCGVAFSQDSPVEPQV